MREPRLARRFFDRFEPVHAVTYFSPESRAAFDGLGYRGFWMGYFAGRSAPLGVVPTEVVTAMFYNFAPGRVAKALPAAWEVAPPGSALRAREDSAVATLRRYGMTDDGVRTADDLAALQELLDRSYAGAGAHLLRIITPEHRLTAEQLAERLTGMSLLALATATADGRPIVGPVDGIFFRGALYAARQRDEERAVRLHRLELQNFRQHAESVVTFETGLTGIIGTNGSGKTTILEAIAWALYGNSATRGTRRTRAHKVPRPPRRFP